MSVVSGQTHDLIRDLLPLVGVVVGAVVTARVTAGNDSRRWRRDFTLDVYREQRDFAAQILVNVDNQFILLNHVCDILRGRGGPDDVLTRLASARDEWRRLLAVRGTLAQPGVQDAMTSFDVSRANVHDLINAQDKPPMDGALARLEAARGDVVEQINTYLQASGSVVARHVHPGRTRLWRRLRGEPLDYF